MKTSKRTHICYYRNIQIWFNDPNDGVTEETFECNLFAEGFVELDSLKRAIDRWFEGK